MNDKDLDELLKNSAPCSYCGISGLHVCDRPLGHNVEETQEQLIRRVIREEIKLAFPERYAAKL